MNPQEEIRCICLYCNHWPDIIPEGVHNQGHKGHLSLFPGKELETSNFEWHLFWLPSRGAVWRKLKGYASISTTEDKAFQTLHLSLRLACDLLHSSQLEQLEDLDSDFDSPLQNTRYRLNRRE
jgi:hypothetical protein